MSVVPLLCTMLPQLEIEGAVGFSGAPAITSCNSRAVVRPPRALASVCRLRALLSALALCCAGAVKSGLILHPKDTHIIYPLGSAIVLKNVESDEQTILMGHTDRVVCMALSPDGNTLASGQITEMGYLADIILWDLSCIETGEGEVEQVGAAGTSPVCHSWRSRSCRSATAKRAPAARAATCCVPRECQRAPATATTLASAWTELSSARACTARD